MVIDYNVELNLYDDIRKKMLIYKLVNMDDWIEDFNPYSQTLVYQIMRAVEE